MALASCAPARAASMIPVASLTDATGQALYPALHPRYGWAGRTPEVAGIALLQAMAVAVGGTGRPMVLEGNTTVGACRPPLTDATRAR